MLRSAIQRLARIVPSIKHAAPERQYLFQPPTRRVKPAISDPPSVETRSPNFPLTTAPCCVTYKTPSLKILLSILRCTGTVVRGETEPSACDPRKPPSVSDWLLLLPVLANLLLKHHQPSTTTAQLRLFISIESSSVFRPPNQIHEIRKWIILHSFSSKSTPPPANPHLRAHTPPLRLFGSAFFRKSNLQRRIWVLPHSGHGQTAVKIIRQQ